MLPTLLDYCSTNHQLCPLLSAKRLPTRTLHISGEFPELYLTLHVSTENEEGKYAALSYCWGGPQALCLTMDNLKYLQNAQLYINQLPKTLSDAILVTRSLDLQFLWVDALCIIQDSPADKEHEINKMCSIYENSIITIAASTSDSVKTGFIKPTISYNTPHSSCTVQLPFQNQDGEEGWADVTFSPSQTQHTDAYPINKRGWTFQEAFVPHRMLVFGDIEPFLRCRSSDTVRLSQSTTSYYNSRIEPRRVLYGGKPYNSSYPEEHDERQFRGLWKYIVEQYSFRQFSLEADRPLAIRGVVEFLTKIYKGECYHGIWSMCPISCLLWASHPREGEEPVRRPEVPTWSWMSLSSTEIDSSNLELLGNNEGEATIRFSDAPHDQLHITCQVLYEEEVYKANDIVDYWDDLGHDWSGVDDTEWEGLFLLVLARTVNQRLLTIETKCGSDGVYRRRGVMEIREVEKWLSRPKVTIALH